jgi:hypothetical protein
MSVLPSVNVAVCQPFKPPTPKIPEAGKSWLAALMLVLLALEHHASVVPIKDGLPRMVA